MSDDLALPDAQTIGDDLLILFPHDGRPTVRQVRSQVGSSDFADLDGPDLDVGDQAVDIAAPGGIALLRSGLGFDLVGLAPGSATPVPDVGERDAVLRASMRAASDASSLRLGPHIAAGKRSLAVLREWFGLGHAIAEAFGATSLCWVPGEVVIGPDRLAGLLRSWDARSDVPVSLLASFHPTLDGAIQSRGLAFFTGQEFRVEARLVRAGEEEALARLIFSHLFYDGPHTATGVLAAPDGHALVLEPGDNGRLVRVWPG